MWWTRNKCGYSWCPKFDLLLICCEFVFEKILISPSEMFGQPVTEHSDVINTWWLCFWRALRVLVKMWHCTGMNFDIWVVNSSSYYCLMQSAWLSWNMKGICPLQLVLPLIVGCSKEFSLKGNLRSDCPMTWSEFISFNVWFWQWSAPD